MPQCCYLVKGAKRPSHTTNMPRSSNKSSSRSVLLHCKNNIFIEKAIKIFLVFGPFVCFFGLFVCGPFVCLFCPFCLEAFLSVALLSVHRGKGVGLGFFSSDSPQSQSYQFIGIAHIGPYYGVENDCKNFPSNLWSFSKSQKKSKNGGFLAIFGLI